MFPCRQRFCCSLLLAQVFAAASAGAATVTWDSDASFGNGVTNGNGTWNLSGSNWYTGTTDRAWNNVNGDTAQFGSGAVNSISYTVTLSGSLSAKVVTFQSSFYDLAGGTLNITGSTIASNSSAGGGIDSIIAGTGGLLKAGSGTLYLNGTNTYGGGTLITGGLVIDGAASATSGAFGAFNDSVNDITVQSGATVDINGAGNNSDFYYGLTISGSGSSGQGALINNGISGSILHRQSPNITLAANAAIGGTGDIYMIEAAYGLSRLDLAGNMLAKTGTNAFYLCNTTVTAGTMNVSQGTVAVAHTQSTAGSTGFIISPGAVLSLNGFDLNIGSLTGGGAVLMGSYSLTVGGDNASPPAFSGVVSGTGNDRLIKTGSGVQTLSGLTNVATIDVNSGALQLTGGTCAAYIEIGLGGPGVSATVSQNGNANCTPPVITVYQGSYNLSGSASLTSIDETLSGGSFSQSGGTHSVTDELSLGGAFSLSGGSLTAFNETVGNNSLPGGGSFSQSGGTHSVTENILVVANGAYALSGGLFKTPGDNIYGSFTQTGGVHVAGSLSFTYGTCALSAGSLATGGEMIDGVFTQTGGTNAISGALTLAPDSLANGTYHFNGGHLLVSNVLKGSGSANFNFGGGTLAFSAPSTLAMPMTLTGSGGNSVIDTSAGNVIVTALFSGPGGFTKAGLGTLTFSTTQNYTGPTVVSGGTLLLSSAGKSTSFTVNGGALLEVLNGNFNLGGGLIRALNGGTAQYQNSTVMSGYLHGPGTHVTLLGTTNLFSGVTTYASAVFAQSGSDTFLDFTNGGQLANSAPLVWDGGKNDIGGTLTVSSTLSASDFTNAGVITIANHGVINNHLSDLTSGGGGRITINSGGTLNADSQSEGVALDLQDSLLVNNGTVTGTTNVYYGATAKGSGTFGPINILDGGTLAIAPIASPVAPSMVVANGSISGSGTSSVPATIHSATIVASNPAEVLVLSGNITGDGTLTKLGVGTVLLKGVNTYSGGTTVLAGELIATSSTALPDGSDLSVGAAAAFGEIVPASAASGQLANAVPEPNIVALLIAGLTTLALFRRLHLTPSFSAKVPAIPATTIHLGRQ